MPTMEKLPDDDMRVVEFANYETTEEYANTRRWALKEANVDGSLWAAFIEGWNRKPSKEGEAELPASDNKSSPKFPKSYEETEKLFLEWWHTGGRRDTLSRKNMKMFYDIVVGNNGR